MSFFKEKKQTEKLSCWPHLSEMDLCPGEDSDSLTRNDPLIPEERRYSAAFLEMGPWYQLCFSRELTGVT